MGGEDGEEREGREGAAGLIDWLHAMDETREMRCRRTMDLNLVGRSF